MYAGIRCYVWAQVARRRIPRDDAEDVIQDSVLRAWRYASSWSPEKGALGTWAAAIARRVVSDYLRRSAEEAEMKRELSGTPIDPASIVPNAAIRAHEDALYEWEERIGIWMDSNVAIYAGDLARLRNHLCKKYGLKAKR